MSLLTERYDSQITGVLSCYDRIIITGTLPGGCYPEGTATYLRVHGVRLFDYPHITEPLREVIRVNAEQRAREQGIAIEFIRSVGAFRKEDRIRAVLERRGMQPGLVHIFSAMEPCPAFMAWHDKASGKTTLHYYVYFLDEAFGQCYLRVPTWAPFRLQFYCNGHNWLAGQLARAGLARLDEGAEAQVDHHGIDDHEHGDRGQRADCVLVLADPGGLGMAQQDPQTHGRYHVH
jgi:hypothetical protein